ncbi:hypothetical protein HDU78_001264 [Chytriomyces hyalinus]|nr:hypothetical protein HDU78_001264 [Chytriomyces hyalinus]
MTSANEIRASFTDTTIRVYQAYNAAIAHHAVAHQKFHGAPGFNPTRMTWIKPSFCWMAYRSGYSYKDANQARILAIDLHQPKFLEILSEAVISDVGRTQPGECRKSDVVVQWDPERDVSLNRLEMRSLQVGLRGEMARRYAEGEFISAITDVTEQFQSVKEALDSGLLDRAIELCPAEAVFETLPPRDQTLA